MDSNCYQLSSLHYYSNKHIKNNNETGPFSSFEKFILMPWRFFVEKQNNVTP